MPGSEKVWDVVRVHPQTCSNYQNFVTRKSITKPARKKMRTMQVDQRVWKTALEIAGGDRSRLVVRHETEVVVVNQSKRKKR